MELTVLALAASILLWMLARIVREGRATRRRADLTVVNNGVRRMKAARSQITVLEALPTDLHPALLPPALLAAFAPDRGMGVIRTKATEF